MFKCSSKEEALQAARTCRRIEPQIALYVAVDKIGCDWCVFNASENYDSFADLYIEYFGLYGSVNSQSIIRHYKNKSGEWVKEKYDL